MIFISNNIYTYYIYIYNISHSYDLFVYFCMIWVTKFIILVFCVENDYPSLHFDSFLINKLANYKSVVSATVFWLRNNKLDLS